MKWLLYNRIDFMIHGEMTVNNLDVIRILGDQLSQVKMKLAALKALVIGIHLYLDFGLHGSDPGMSIRRQSGWDV